jgi:hypothetical protein
MTGLDDHASALASMTRDFITATARMLKVLCDDLSPDQSAPKINHLIRRLVDFWGDVAVHIARGGDGSVAKALLNNLYRNPRLKRGRGVGVPQIVERDDRQFRQLWSAA